MAHRTDVIQVHQDFPTTESMEVVVDPNCGRKITRKETQSILFREDQKLYFCSKRCREEYMAREKQPPKAA